MENERAFEFKRKNCAILYLVIEKHVPENHNFDMTEEQKMYLGLLKFKKALIVFMPNEIHEKYY